MQIYVAGISGMVGSAISIESIAQGHEVTGRPSKELDFTDRKAVFEEMKTMKFP